jgi:hypothetical protein
MNPVHIVAGGNRRVTELGLDADRIAVLHALGIV